MSCVQFGMPDIDKFTPAELRKSVAAAIRQYRGKGSTEIAVALGDTLAEAEFVAAAAEGAILGDYEPDQLKTDPKKSEKVMEALLQMKKLDIAGLKRAYEQK